MNPPNISDTGGKTVKIRKPLTKNTSNETRKQRDIPVTIEPFVETAVAPSVAVPSPQMVSPAITVPSPQMVSPAITVPSPQMVSPAITVPSPQEVDDISVNNTPGDKGTVLQPNEKRRKQEKDEFDTDEDPSHNFLYPTLNDPAFAAKIATHTEFNDTQYDGEIRDIQSYADKMCDAEFELLPHQLFVKNFLSFQTPYNSLLLYHGLGSGKTCSSIGIAEEMRAYMKQVGIKQRIIVVASPNVQSNFKLQLFDENRLSEIDGVWNIDSCIGNALVKEVNPTTLKGLSREKVVSQIKTIINQYYVFMGYVELANYIRKRISVPSNADYSPEEVRKQEIVSMRKYFNNRMIIIDEVHNIRMTKDNVDGKTAQYLMKLAKNCNNMRLLMLSATPMYNSHSEIIWLVNLMNANDKRGLITADEVFLSDGTFKKPTLDAQGNVTEEGGRELLHRKLIGYVSYVRGENPYTFPYRIYPDIFAKERTFREAPSPIGSLVNAGTALLGASVKQVSLPTTQLNGRKIETPMLHLPVYISELESYQEQAYKLVVKGIRKDVDASESRADAFDDLDRFGFRQLQTPIEALNMVYPSPNLDAQIERGELMPDESSTEDDENKDPRATMVGKRGMNSVMTYKDESSNKIPMKYNFTYRPEIESKYGRIFSQSEIPKYSAKIARICDIIRHSTGIVMIYSQYIDGGIVPMALALEEMGFTRAGSSPNTKSLFAQPPTPPIDALTMQPRIAGSKTFFPAKYIMITGDKAYSPQNAADMKLITSSNNTNGEGVKVVLISKAGSEGLDFKCIRQLHILEPWYNMNRIEQVIGRGVRNLSHCRLPFKMRNVEIYMHVSLLKTALDEEAVDIYVYRLAKKKAELIGEVTRLMKETAVDCVLNIKQINFSVEKMVANAANKEITLELSTDKKELVYQIGDRPHTDICDYMDECSFKCNVGKDIKRDPVQETYSTVYAQSNNDRIMNRIRQIYRDDTKGESFYTLKELIEKINVTKEYPITQIYAALSSFVKNKTDYLFDRYGRRGNMVNKKEIYAFQPIEINDEHITIFERSIPVDYKNRSVVMEIPETFAQTVQEDDAEVGVETPSMLTKSTYSDIIEDITRNVKNSTTVTAVVQGEQDWYKHASRVVNHLQTVHKINITEIVDFVIHHNIDIMMPEDKITIASHMYSKIRNPSELSETEQAIKKYFDTKIVTYRNKTLLLLADKNNWKLYKQSTEDNGQWIQAEPEDVRIFEEAGALYNQFHKDPAKYSNNVGFIDMFRSGKEMVFRIKDITKMQNNTGIRLAGHTPTKGDIIKYLNGILGTPMYDSDNTKEIMQLGLCVIVEMILRHRTWSKFNGMIWFFTPEEAEYNKIAKYRKG